MRVTMSVLAAVCAAGVASAQTPIGPFTGDISETWESFQNYLDNPNFYEDATGPVSIFGGNAMISTPASGAGGLLVVYEPSAGAGFGLGDYGSAQVSDGTKGSGINGGFPEVAATIDFGIPVTDFGGYWGAADIFGNPTVPISFDFYDASGNLLGRDVVQYGDSTGQGQLMWFGWNFNSIGAVSTVVYTGDFVVNDGLQANLIPAPGALGLVCIAGLALGRRRR